MLGIYYGHAKGKTCTCMGATIRSVLKGRSVLYIQFLRDETVQIKKALGFFPEISHMTSPIEYSEDMLSDGNRKAQAKINYKNLFDSAVMTVLTKNFDFLILDGIFDISEKGLLSENDIYEFLSNAPDSLEIICTGVTFNEKFRPLSSYCIELRET